MPSKPLLSVVVLGLLAPAASGLRAQDAVPSPSEFHGYPLGSRYTITSALYDYYRALAQASPRVEYREYGTSVQGRPLPMLLVGTEEYLAREEEIRRGTRRIGGAEGPLPRSTLDELVRRTPAVVWIFIVDTDEEAGVEVLQEVAHDLATREDETARLVRNRVLTIFTPLTNPDSHARYVTWHKIYNVDGAATDPLAVENDAHWAMNTDGNAWGVDVNRDFGFFVTPEMGALGRQVTAWRPQFFLDVHSGPDVLFVPPFPRPFHPLWPDEAPRWWNAVAERANRAFGERGWSFSTRKDYEGVAGVGFGLSWGMLGPAGVSFLFENFGGRPGKTTAFVRSDGSVGTLRRAMDEHALGIWSLLETAAEEKRELQRDVHEKAARAMDDAGRGAVRTVVLPASGPGVDPEKTARLVDRLLLQEVEVRRAAAPFSQEVREFLDLGSAARAREFPAGTYVVDLVQPSARLARALLDPTLDFTNPRVEVPYDRKMPFYDAPWGNLPYLFGVPAYVSAQAPPRGEAVAGTPDLEGGVEWIPAGADGAAAPRPDLPYAWVLRPDREASWRTAVALMREGYGVRVFTSGARIGDTEIPKGSLTLLRSRNPEGLAERIASLADGEGAPVTAVGGPYTDAGIAFGDDARVAALPRPRIAVLADWPVTHDHTYGGIRSVLEGDFGVPFSPVMLGTLQGADLSAYTAVVLPHGGMSVRGGPNFGPGYADALDPGNLREYVVGGGTLIAVQGAAEFMAADPVLGVGIEVDGWAERTEAAVVGEFVTEPTPRDEVVPWRPGLEEIGVPLLAAGYPSPRFAAPASFPVLFRVPEEGGARVVARYGSETDGLVLDGFMMDQDRPILTGRPFMVVAEVGRGRVISFAEDPTFRGQWYGMNLLWLSALLVGPAI